MMKFKIIGHCINGNLPSVLHGEKLHNYCLTWRPFTHHFWSNIHVCLL